MRNSILIALALGMLVSGASAVQRMVLPASSTGPMTLDFVQGYRFDPLVSQPTLPSNLSITGYAKGTKGYYLVQFAGPIDYTWKEHVNDLGGFVLGYQPNYAFVVRMDEAVKAKVEQLPEVRWVGLLQPAWKLFPYNLLGKGSRHILVLLHPGESDGAFEAKAKALGGKDFTWDINEVNKSVSFFIDASRIPDLARLTEVDWVEPWMDWSLDNTDAQWLTQMGWRSTAPPTGTRTIWQKGVRGDWMEGTTHKYIVTGHCDDGLDVAHYAFRDSFVSITAPGDYPTHRKVIKYISSYSASSHGTHTAGTVAGNDNYYGGTSTNDGMAPMAKIIHKTVSSIADMNTLWGDMYTGNSAGKAFSMTMSMSRKDSFNLYVFTDMTADQFHWRYKDFIETNSLGNYYLVNTMGHPVVAKDQISISAVDNGIAGNTISTYTSIGPAADGRLKPNLCSPGTNLMSATAGTTNSYGAMSGTSMATPCAQGNVALVRCYFEKGFYPTGDSVAGNRRHPSGALVKAVMTVGAEPNVTSHTPPDVYIGWGRISLDSSLYFAGDTKLLWVYDDTTRGLRTGDSAMYSITVTNAAHPLRVVMCYSDTAGPMRATRTLINDLDLTVISPTGTPYLGNVWSGGQSQTGGLRDSIQETECFRLNAPATGVWRVKVKGRNVPVGGAKGQPYAVTATGAITTSGVEETAWKESVLPSDFDLGAAVPNPLGDQTDISFALPKASTVTLRVFTLTGQLVKTLAEGQHSAGIHRASWDGRDLLGNKVPSGVYFYRLEAPSFSSTKKMVVVR